MAIYNNVQLGVVDETGTLNVIFPVTTESNVVVTPSTINGNSNTLATLISKLKSGAFTDAYSLPTATSSTLGGIKVGTNLSINNGVLSAVDTTYTSKNAVSGGTDVSLCTTGEKYTWNSERVSTSTFSSTMTGIGTSLDKKVESGTLMNTYKISDITWTGITSSSGDLQWTDSFTLKAGVRYKFYASCGDSKGWGTDPEDIKWRYNPDKGTLPPIEASTNDGHTAIGYFTPTSDIDVTLIMFTAPFSNCSTGGKFSVVSNINAVFTLQEICDYVTEKAI